MKNAYISAFLYSSIYEFNNYYYLSLSLTYFLDLLFYWYYFLCYYFSAALPSNMFAPSCFYFIDYLSSCFISCFILFEFFILTNYCCSMLL